MRRYTRHLAPLLLLPLLLAFGACNDNDPVTPDVDTPSLPSTLDDLATAFQTSQDSLDIEGYTRLLHPDFVWATLLDTTSWDLATEIAISTAIFTGVAGTDEDREGDQNVVVESSSFNPMTPTGDWNEISVDDPIFGAHTDGHYRTYNVDIRFNIAGDGYDFHVAGLVLIYAVPTDDGYQILGVREMNFKKSVATISWTDVKSMWR